MKIDWKRLSLAMITSLVVTGILGLICSLTYTLIAKPDMPIGKVTHSVVVTGGTGVYLILSLTGIIVLGLTCISIFTVIFYFVFGKLFSLKKKQKT